MRRNHRQLVEEYLENCTRLNRSFHTIKNYRADLERFIQWFEKEYRGSLSKVDAEVIGNYGQFLAQGYTQPRAKSNTGLLRFLKKMNFWKKSVENPRLPPIQEKGPLAVASRRRHLSALKNFFEYLKQTHEDKGKSFLINPVKSKIHNIRLKDTDFIPTEMLLPEEWERLDEVALGAEDRLMIYLLYYGGMRLSELTFLRVDQFNADRGTVTFERKGGHIHQLELQNAPVLFELLERHQGRKRCDSPYVFSAKSGKAVTTKTMYNRLNKLFLQAECRHTISPHSFRKACATQLYRRTKDLLYVRDYLNHRDAKITQHYIDSKYLHSERVSINT